MGPVKSLWAMVQGDPIFMRKVNGWLAVIWILMIPISLFMGWLDSVMYVSALSLWASSRGIGLHGRLPVLKWRRWRMRRSATRKI